MNLENIVDVEKLAAKSKGANKKKKSLLSTLLSDLSNIKVALGSLIAASGLDIYLTHLGLKNFIEGNSLAVPYMTHLGEIPGMIVDSAVCIGFFIASGALIESQFKRSIKRNSSKKIFLYSGAAVEAFVSFSNYLTLTGHATPTSYLLQNYGVYGVDTILAAACVAPALAYTFYQVIKDLYRRVQIRPATI
jgi:hypothetical protein